jgi:hypothetical protein
LAAVLNGTFVVQGPSDACGTNGISAAQRSGHNADCISAELSCKGCSVTRRFQSALGGGSILGIDDG